MSAAEEPLSAPKNHELIRRFEAEEDAFLREVEAMQQQCANTDTSDEPMQEEQQAPVLGTLCSLVGEISQLRRENRHLRRRLTGSVRQLPHHHDNDDEEIGRQHSATQELGLKHRHQISGSVPKLAFTPTNGTSAPGVVGGPGGASVIQRVNAFFEKSHRSVPRLITTASNRLLSSSSSGSFSRKGNAMNNQHPPAFSSKIPTVATHSKSRSRGQCDSSSAIQQPPPASQSNVVKKTPLNSSIYSVDLSSDTQCSIYRERNELPNPVVSATQPLSDNFERGGGRSAHHFTDSASGTAASVGDGSSSCGNGTEGAGEEIGPRRSMARRSQLITPHVSEHASAASSVSASSSAEPSEERMTSSRSSFLELFGIKKCRNKAPFSTVKDSFELLSGKKRKRRGGDSGSDSSQYAPDAPQCANKASLAGIGCVQPMDSSWSDQFPSVGMPLFAASDQRVPHQQKRLRRHSRYENHHHGDDGGRGGKVRPKSMIYLDPRAIPVPNGSLKAKARSCRNIHHRTAGRDAITSSADDAAHEENALLRNEVRSLKARNNRLIDQLRQKSMQLSRVESAHGRVESELKSMKREERFDELLRRRSLRECMVGQLDGLFGALEVQLHSLESEIRLLKGEIARVGETANNASLAEQRTQCNYIEQTERLQHDNLVLLQQMASGLDEPNRFMRQKLDMLPSYDALYSFAVGMIKKLGRLRCLLIERSREKIQVEAELIQTQTCLLMSQMQAEKLRVGRQLFERRRGVDRRPDSYAGDDFETRMVQRTIDCRLAFVLHGRRIRQQNKRGTSMDVDALVENNEQEIEVEFLRLFDYARRLSKICEDSSPLLCRRPTNSVVYRNGLGVGSPMGSPSLARGAHFTPPSQRSPFLQKMMSVSPKTGQRMSGRKEDARSGGTPPQSVNISRRPMSWMEGSVTAETNGQRPPSVFDETPITNASSPLLNLHRLSNLVFRSGGGGGRSASSKSKSPSTTPVFVRRVVPLLGSAGNKTAGHGGCGGPPSTMATHDSHPAPLPSSYDRPPATAVAEPTRRVGSCSNSDSDYVNSGSRVVNGRQSLSDLHMARQHGMETTDDVYRPNIGGGIPIKDGGAFRRPSLSTVGGASNGRPVVWGQSRLPQSVNFVEQLAQPAAQNQTALRRTGAFMRQESPARRPKPAEPPTTTATSVSLSRPTPLAELFQAQQRRGVHAPPAVSRCPLPKDERFPLDVSNYPAETLMASSRLPKLQPTRSMQQRQFQQPQCDSNADDDEIRNGSSLKKTEKTGSSWLSRLRGGGRKSKGF